MNSINKLFLLCTFSLSLSACYSNSQTPNWPENIPSRSVFVNAYNQQISEGRNNTNIDTHLKWVKRFYKGLSIYPGWNDMTKLVLDSITNQPEQLQKDTVKRLSALGERICIEWAQSNDTRNIDSININTWGLALRKSVKQDNLFPFLDRVEDDVEQLIAKELDMRAITSERYHTAEDYNDF